MRALPTLSPREAQRAEDDGAPILKRPRQARRLGARDRPGGEAGPERPVAVGSRTLDPVADDRTDPGQRPGPAGQSAGALAREPGARGRHRAAAPRPGGPA